MQCPHGRQRSQCKDEPRATCPYGQPLALNPKNDTGYAHVGTTRGGTFFFEVTMPAELAIELQRARSPAKMDRKRQDGGKKKMRFGGHGSAYEAAVGYAHFAAALASGASATDLLMLAPPTTKVAAPFGLDPEFATRYIAKVKAVWEENPHYYGFQAHVLATRLLEEERLAAAALPAPAAAWAAGLV